MSNGTGGLWSVEKRQRSESGKVILLDLNYTLVSNSMWLRKNRGDAVREEFERYRMWLIEIIEMMRPRAVIMLTVRGQDWQERTLAMMEKHLEGWQPDECCFSEFNADPPTWKNWAMRKKIMPKYGSDPNTYMAFESNTETWKKVFIPLGIKGFKAFPHTEVLSDSPSPEQVEDFRTGQKSLLG